MWSCPYCGSSEGIRFKDGNLSGMLCMSTKCGRFHQMDEAQYNELIQEQNHAENLA